MDLFDAAPTAEPLAHRMRPRSIEEFYGQTHIVGHGRLLRRVIQADQLTSLIFYGPPGTGKTTLARVIANTTKSHFITMNAVLSGVKDLRAAIAEAKELRSLHGRRSLLFVDEVHRWNKAQQDALLPWVENGTVILIGATTENPFFEVNSALVSRSRVFQLKPLDREDLREIVGSALSDSTRGYGKFAVTIDDDALEHLISVSNGDARSLLNALELAVETTPEAFPPPAGEAIHVTLEIAEESIQRKVVLYDKEGDYHFDTISAFIKSIRGSDPDAALYWMARMVYAGEDPRYIFRRMLISAAEDIGLADPDALGIVESAAAAFDRVGMPEGQFFLSEAALYLATTEKSNSTLAFFDAVEAVERERSEEVPSHLKDGNRDKQEFGHGEGYLYPHAYRDHWVAQHYLPESLQGTVFYQPGVLGYERDRRDDILRRREAQLAVMSASANQEVLTFSPPNTQRDRWFARLVEQRGRTYEAIREQVFALSGQARHHAVLDLNAGSGLFLWEALRNAPEGHVVGLVRHGMDRLEAMLQQLEEVERPALVQVGSTLSETLAGLDESFERAIAFNLFATSGDDPRFATSIANTLSDEGRLVLAELIPSEGQYLAELLDASEASDQSLVDEFRDAEYRVRSDTSILAYRWTSQSIQSHLEQAGWNINSAETQTYTEERVVTQSDVENWLAPEQSTYGSALSQIIGAEALSRVSEAICSRVGQSPVAWKRSVAYVVAQPEITNAKTAP